MGALRGHIAITPGDNAEVDIGASDFLDGHLDSIPAALSAKLGHIHGKLTHPFQDVMHCLPMGH
jgi:hypothetical protein